MAGPIHTYGPTCLLADEEDELSPLHSLPAPPDVRAHFFYVSSLPIDDPLAPLPSATGLATNNERAPPQPFAARDNIALEAAWQELRQTRGAGSPNSRPQTAKDARTGIAVPGREHFLDSGLMGSRGNSVNTPTSFPEGQSLRSRLERDTSNPKTRAGDDSREPDLDSFASQRKRDRSSSMKDSTPAKKRNSFTPEMDGTDDGEERGPSIHATHSRDASISGSPFARAPISQRSHSPLGRSVESLSLRDEGQGEIPRSSAAHRLASKPSGLRASLGPDEMAQNSSRDGTESTAPQLMIPVGVSRLHLVELPNLKMKPIYWSPLHDISSVLRATWFYRNTMLPVETDLANKLEEGYNYLKPWTETWQDELNSCMENGAAAEMKIVHRLFSKDDSLSRPETAQGQQSVDSEEAVHHMTFENNQAAGGTAAHLEAIKPYVNSSAIYVDAKNAQILRPSLLPSVSRGRRPLSAIRKGRQIGIPVVRGFSRKLWDKLHPSKPNPIDVRHYIRRTQSRDSAAAPGQQICYGCRMEELRPQPTDLVLVIHGIGQKLSERMESYHFTHAINAFRREVNMELNNEPVWPHVRQDHGGIMVLPVNWRSTLSLEEANIDSPTSEDLPNQFSLADITPQTLPAVRALISDVMLDIPYYLSHHKPKMIKAVVREANRVYRLWCKNNPHFREHGRVHLLAHSLGSVMALDILSHQPTHVPQFDFSTTPLHHDIFEFDTRHLFLCGSPVGFFLLLNKASLLPRKGRDKPGSEGEDRLRGVAGDADKYGCLAVDNLYNIMHTTDPIAYRVNAAVDTDLSNSLKTAAIPSSTSTFWQSLSSVFRWSPNSSSAFIPSLPTSTTITGATRPAAISKLPSNVELETHDFTREEIAEKRMLLLNDNGQIDFYLSGGGGPLNIQYLNMLSAHSSYWTLADFVRFFVIELARKPGREGTLRAFRAEKKVGWKYSKG
ncbi:hypothetical protein N7510_007620 [Penicillium lagena]|uniref:uncharacterized protein n=1 Tax=Penicillium lagena TaxID=94218 RepID=UPI0025400E52|nr:uncharacterized protein N7510_007620 [Penicillium lagena]KAJ5610901.1 hypothetical protein N7510_007620 [Penicillium lagena]